MGATPTNRRELRASHARLAAAISEEADCISSVAELKATIEAGKTAESQAVAGLLAREGKPSDESIETNRIIAHGSLARLALPEAEKALEAAHSEVVKLKTEV